MQLDLLDNVVSNKIELNALTRLNMFLPPPPPDFLLTEDSLLEEDSENKKKGKKDQSKLSILSSSDVDSAKGAETNTIEQPRTSEEIEILLSNIYWP